MLRSCEKWGRDHSLSTFTEDPLGTGSEVKPSLPHPGRRLSKGEEWPGAGSRPGVATERAEEGGQSEGEWLGWRCGDVADRQGPFQFSESNEENQTGTKSSSERCQLPEGPRGPRQRLPRLTLAPSPFRSSQALGEGQPGCRTGQLHHCPAGQPSPMPRPRGGRPSSEGAASSVLSGPSWAWHLVG